MAKNTNKYEVRVSLIGCVVHWVNSEGIPQSTPLDVDTDQEVLEQLYKAGIEGIIKVQ